MSEITLIGRSGRVPVNFLGLYSDATPMVKLDFEPTDVHTIVVRPSSLSTFVTAMFLVDSINALGGWVQTLVLPYVPGARQDRINPTGDVLWTAKSVAEMINQRKFGRVVILDPHSPVTPSLIDRVSVFPLAKVFEKFHPRAYDGIIAPDKGAKDRAEEAAAVLGLPVFYASKNRNVTTGKLSGFSVNVQPGHYLVVDDICDGGGTFLGLGNKILDCGATADLFVTHGIFAKGTAALRDIYNTIYTTDSRQIHERNVVTEIPVIERMITNG